MKRILITGANGYLGRGIVSEISKVGGYHITATDFSFTLSDGDTCGNIEKKECNLFEVEDPYHYFGEPDVVVHLAWRKGFVHYADEHMADLPLHCRFIKKMAESDTERIAVMGTMHEVGFFEGSIKSDTPCHPESFYGIAKNALREYTRILCRQNGKKLQWLRAYYIVGNSLKGSSIFSKISEAAKNGNKTFPFTMGLNQFDFLDYDEFCRRVAMTVLQDESLGIINICHGRPEKLADRVERFIKENHFDIALDYGKFPDRPYDSKAVWGDSREIDEIIKKVKLFEDLV